VYKHILIIKKEVASQSLEILTINQV